MKKINNIPVIQIFILLISFLSTATALNSDTSLDPAPKGSFSIVVMADTQSYLGKGTKGHPDSQDEVTNPIFDSQTNWIVNNKEKQHVVFVSHVGDVVDMNNRDQWDKAKLYLNKIHGVIPYGMSVGNHDMESSGNSSLFQSYFPASLYKDFGWYGGSYVANPQSAEKSGNNANSFQLFSAEGIDFVILHLECNAPDPVLQWADAILDKYNDRFAIVTTHMYLGPLNNPKTPDDFFHAPKGVMLWHKCHGASGNSAQEMWDKCFRKHGNLQLIFCGDQSRSNAMYVKQVGDHGNIVHAMMSDYSAGKHGGIRVYRFLPAAQQIRVTSYDAMDDKVIDETKIVPEKQAHNFSIAVKFHK